MILASELTVVDEPELTDSKQFAELKKAGVPATIKISRRLYLRKGVKVAAFVTETTTILNAPPTVRKYVQFLIDDDNWIEFLIEDPSIFTSRQGADTTVSATGDSITVRAEKRLYFEIYFRSTGKFLDAPDRDKLAPDFLKSIPKPR